MNFARLFSSRGYLFTISIIVFASTLVVFSQYFAQENLLDERLIISLAKPLAMAYSVDDVASDFAGLFGFNFDLNDSSASSVTVSGSFPSSNHVSSALNDYAAFAPGFFARSTAQTKSLDLSGLSDGKAEYFVGSSLGFDYNYSSNSVDLFPRGTADLERIDLNINASSSLSSYEWTNPGEGTVPFHLNYSDSSRTLSFDAEINPSLAYSLKLVYADTNAFINLGSVSGVSGSVFLQPKSAQRMDFVLKNSYSNRLSLRPVKLNAVLRIAGEGMDSNALLVIKK